MTWRNALRVYSDELPFVFQGSLCNRWLKVGHVGGCWWMECGNIKDCQIALSLGYPSTCDVHDVLRVSTRATQPPRIFMAGKGR